MKKLTKMSLDELAKAMYVIDESEQDSFSGMYNSDCFWRCVAYMEMGGGKITEEMAASYALDYYTNAVYGGYAGTDSYLNSNGAGMSLYEIRSYIMYSVEGGNYDGPSSSGQYIAYFKTGSISLYEDTGTAHAVVVLGINPDGSAHIYDPQNGNFETIPAFEATSLTRVMY